MGLWGWLMPWTRTFTIKTDKGVARVNYRTVRKINRALKKIHSEDSKLSDAEKNLEGDKIKKDFLDLIEFYNKINDEIISILRDEDILEIHQIKELRKIADELIKRAHSKQSSVAGQGEINEIRTLLEEVKTHARTIIDNIEKQFKVGLCP
jgi:hypothetical protein